jgi:SAM-dependent MidA family methyltransferase
MALYDIVIQKIQAEGPIPFHDYMEMCLYHPSLGYYTSAHDKIGVNGDYYTSSSLTQAFGAMIATQIERMWRELGQGPFTIVEYGAGTGSLCHDILDHLRNNSSLYAGLDYCIIEKSPVMREKEITHLKEKVRWLDSISEIADMTGCVISNELLDNFSIHQVVMESELEEIFIDYKNGFIEVLRPASKILKDYMSELGIRLPKGFRTEINIEATEWIKEISSALARGYVLTIDYGYPSSELYKDYRRSGTLLCYHKHQVNDNPYKDIGEQDITSHVNFSALCHWGVKYGLSCCAYMSQADFLLALGFEDHLRQMRAETGFIDQKQEAILKHVLLEDMGRKYKVLIQGKGIGAKQIPRYAFA